MSEARGSGHNLMDLTSLEFVEELYEAWLRDPSSVNSGWQAFFHDFDLRGSLDLGTPRRKPLVLMSPKRLLRDPQDPVPPDLRRVPGGGLVGPHPGAA
ncbi:MAG: hypothetical protein V3V57_08400 [Spirochaetia bacterium]